MEREKLIQFFKDLSFVEDTHTYFIKDKKVDISVSGLYKKFVKPFDIKGTSMGTARKEGKTQQEVLASWKKAGDDACRLGTKVHLFGEKAAFDRTLIPSNGQEVATLKFWNDLPEHIQPCIMELAMYHKIYKFAGTGDILLYNSKTGNYIIADWKTNKNIFKNYKGQRMLEPFSNLLDMPLNLYQLQLSYYQLMFEQTGLKVENRKVVWLRPDGTYQMYDCEDYTVILEQYLKQTRL